MDTHPRTPTQNSPLSARLGKRHSSSFTDELSLELGDGREQVEHQPAGVVVSIDSVSDRRCTSRRPNYSTSSTRCDRERPSRSRRHTVTTSPASTSASTRTSPGRSAAPRRPIDNSPLLVDTGRAQRGDLRSLVLLNCRHARISPYHRGPTPPSARKSAPSGLSCSLLSDRGFRTTLAWGAPT